MFLSRKIYLELKILLRLYYKTKFKNMITQNFSKKSEGKYNNVYFHFILDYSANQPSGTGPSFSESEANWVVLLSSGVSINTNSQRNVSATLLIEVG